MWRERGQIDCSTEGVPAPPVCNSESAGRVGRIMLLSQRSMGSLWKKNRTPEVSRRGLPRFRWAAVRVRLSPEAVEHEWRLR
jgi:hypothetical protein